MEEALLVLAKTKKEIWLSLYCVLLSFLNVVQSDKVSFMFFAFTLSSTELSR